MRSRLLLGAVGCATAAVIASGCGEKKKDVPPADVQITVKLLAGATVSPLLYGANMGWPDNGYGIVAGGELIADRSFRDTAGNAAWSFIPGAGTIVRVATNGDAAPGGHAGYPGYVRLAGGATGSPFILQALTGALTAGSSYVVTFSSFSEDAQTPSVFAGLVHGSAFTAIATTQFDTTTNGAWKHHALSLVPSLSVSDGILVLGIGAAGSVRIDEVRMHAASSVPVVDPVVRSRITSMGITSLRYPQGSLADTFDWKASIGPLAQRGESPADFGRIQTPSLGLDEFLRLCEQLSLTPVLQVNVLDTPQSAADLVQYVNGASSTTWGAMRAANGHAAPYAVRYFELGNEPAAAYAQGGNIDHAGAAYALLAASVADAMTAVDPSIELGGAAEAALQFAAFLPAVPIVANWNGEVFTGPNALNPKLSFVQGHFYSDFLDDADPNVDFRDLMSAGTVLTRTRDLLATNYIGALPLWITEYGVDVENNGAINTANLVDFQSGLVIADMNMAMAENGFVAAHEFDLVQQVGYGMLNHPGAWDLRPSGLAFSLLSPLAGENLFPVVVTGSPTVTISPSIGNIPDGLTYDEIGVLAAGGGTGPVHVVLINRSATTAHRVSVNFMDSSLPTATANWYRNASLAANNETSATTVAITTEEIDFRTAPLSIPAHSLVRLDFH